VQLVHNEGLEIQDFIQYAFDGGALRLCVSPDPKEGDIFALLVDTREPRYANFTQVGSTKRYTTTHHGAYLLVMPLRPVNQKLFDKLKSKLWTDAELQQRLGAPSYHWHVHGVGYSGLTYVPEGLSFIGDFPRPGAAIRYQMYAQDVEAEWGKEHPFDLPPLALLAQLDYATLQRRYRAEFANTLLSQREQIDAALANGKHSPDGRFVVGHVNLVGPFTGEEVVIRELSKPERRYPAPHFTYDKDYLWLNARTILFKVYTTDQEFYTIDATTGAMELEARVPGDQRISDFGVSGPNQFWYKTVDEEKHQVTVQRPTPQD
jgi:hypothetical protein